MAREKEKKKGQHCCSLPKTSLVLNYSDPLTFATDFFFRRFSTESLTVLFSIGCHKLCSIKASHELSLTTKPQNDACSDVHVHI